MLYSDSRKLNIRAVIDDGSQRMYISTYVGKFLDYKPTGIVSIAHSLFGGVNTQSQTHDIYLVSGIKLSFVRLFRVLRARHGSKNCIVKS